MTPLIFPRTRAALLSACNARSVSLDSLIACPITRLEKRSVITAKYSKPSCVRFAFHVGHPHFIGRVCCEATIQPIARDAIGVPRIGGGFVHTLFARFYAGRTHNSCDAISSSDGAARQQFCVNARTSLRLAASPEHGGDRDGENIIFNNARARRSTDPRVISTARNFKHAAKRRDWKPILLDMDELKFHWFPLAKNAAAFFKISKSIKHAFVLAPQSCELIAFIACQRAD